MGDLSLQERAERFAGLAIDPLQEERGAEERQKEAEEDRELERLRQAEALELRAAWASARKTILPVLKQRLERLRGEKAQVVGDERKAAHWSSRIDELLDLITNIEGA